ncbi:hypothetical protein GCM10009601_04710 [Streptomyces thermospinosisporus]|uniref:Low molecular weight protein antigen 6 PH domain-containing protein n=1 Tax=Streptomyces thermospinosisporus TaxID=161482 RepID=A0ABP4J7X1_9ACTN
MVAGSDGRVVRTYRLGAGPLVFVTLLLGWPAVLFVRLVVPDEGLPLMFKASLLVLVGLVCAGVVWLWRAATVVCEDHIAVRQLFRTRRTAWCDVLSIERDRNPASARTLLLDREGRLFALPGGVGARSDAVREIVEVWERSRGEGWASPSAAFAEAARQRARVRESAVVWALLLSAGSFLLLLGCGLAVGYAAEWGGDDIPWVLQVIGFEPVVVFAGVYGVAVRRVGRRQAA